MSDTLLERMIALYQRTRLELIDARGERDAAYADVDRLTARLAAMADERLIALRFHPDDVPVHTSRKAHVYRNRRIPPGALCLCGKPAARHHPVTRAPCCYACYLRVYGRNPEVKARRKQQQRAWYLRQKEQQL